MNPELSDTIDAYLKGELKGEALYSFEHLLKTNDALASEVEIFRLEKRGIERLVEVDLRRKLIHWQDDAAAIKDAQIADMWARQRLIKSNNRLLLFATLCGVFGLLCAYLGFRYFLPQPPPVAPNKWPISYPEFPKVLVKVVCNS